MTDKQYASFLIDRISENTKLQELAKSEGAVQTVAMLQSIIDRDKLKLSIIKQDLDTESLT